MRRGLFQGLQESVEGLGREHVDLIDDRDPEAIPLGLVPHGLDQLAGIFDLAGGSPVDLVHVERVAALQDLAAGGAHAAGIHGGPTLAVQGAREHSRRRGLPHAALSRQQVRRGDPPLRDRVGKRAGDGLLADQVGEDAGAPFARKGEVHRKVEDSGGRR